MAMTPLEEQRIDGIWAVALKILIALVSVIGPPFLAWAVWMTSEQFKDLNFRTSKERFTQTDGRELQDKVANQLLPKIEQVDSRMQSIERDNSRIFTKLEQIEQALNKQ